MILDYIKLVIINLTYRKLRSLLTIIGIFIGIAAVVSLLSLGQGVNVAIREQFEKMDADKIIVLPGSSGQMGLLSASYASKPLTKKDVDEILKVKSVDIAAGIIFKSARVTFGKESKTVFITGIPLDETEEIVKSMQQFEIEKGRDLKENRYEAIIGNDFAYKLFKKEVKVGDEI
jgi:putative ABC transport system permease protein